MALYVGRLVALLVLSAAVAAPPAFNFGYSARSYARHASHSHDFYVLLRWVCCGVFAYSAFTAFRMKRAAWAWTFGILAVLFNPLAPVYLQRATWQIIDSGAIVLIVIAAISFWRSSKTKMPPT